MIPGIISLILSVCVYGQVISVDHRSFRSVVLDSPHVVMVKFYAPWCGHCKQMAPAYQQAANKLKGLVKMAEMDCDNSQNQQLCGQFGVQGFPTIKIFPAGVKGLPTDYQGDRSAKSFIDTLTPMIPSRHVIRIGGTAKKDMSLDEFKEKEAGVLAKVILATDKKTTPALFKALSVEYLDRLLFGIVPSSKTDIINELQVDSYPSLLVIPKDSNEEIIRYTGPIKQEAVVEFLDKYAKPKPVKEKGSKKKDKKSKDRDNNKGTAKVKDSPEEVVDLNIPEVVSDAQLASECLSVNGYCVISFLIHEPEYEESKKAFEEAVVTLKEVKKAYHKKSQTYAFVYVNAINHGLQLVRDFGVSDMYPSMLLIDPKKSKYSLLRTSFEEKSIANFLSRGPNLPYTISPQLDKPKVNKKSTSDHNEL
ncbi:hypothetical protein BC833DRAFT_527527 [Globomyces pollinis-pini]|nr:hypothetical protein BC833DRAFT_527527 [Globomyces pollinis-pini]